MKDLEAETSDFEIKKRLLIFFFAVGVVVLY
ncbi:hypothetical protein SGRA_0551 [Saprospira grandis str. Lewin]|uniref:Uncharacterized protein n=1 Tax=Saprospira grandis (strain Lewin) TaxID=984262 RepID=H6KZ06_SAPGL|nr:hypothetical protein SGRA_0551 [Saprospira grandis str. Lewin]